MKNRHYFLIISGITGLLSCGSSSSGTSAVYVNPHAQKHQQAHQEFALQNVHQELTKDFIAGIEGNYVGNIPCADCEGIQYKLKLNKNLSYTLQLMYKGKSEEISTIDGFYSLTDNFMIVLDQKAGAMNYLTKKDNGLLLLDKEGREIEGDLADTYFLNRVY